MHAPRPTLQYRLFGGLTVLRDGEPTDLGGRKQRAVLAVLVLHADRAVTADRLVDHVWGGEAPRRAEGSLQAYVSKLRRVLEPGLRAGGAYSVLVTEPGGYRLVAERSVVDLTRFDDLRDAGAAALAGGDPATAAVRYDAALALHGPLLPELADEPWVIEAAARVDEAHADALDGAVEAKLALGGGRELIGGLEAAVATHPFRERLRGHLALALYRAGRQTDALRSLAEARRTLADEIGVEPGPQLRQLEADILAHAAHLTAPERRPRAATQFGIVGRAEGLSWLTESARLFELAAAYWDEARRLLDLIRPADRQARDDVLVALGHALLPADDLGGSHGASHGARQTSPNDEVDPPLIGAA
jgi:DNA-binding SARP family transcriptional activator